MTKPNPLPTEKLNLDLRTVELVYTPEAFSRRDPSDDRVFYATDRLVQHLDDSALASVSGLLGIWSALSFLLLMSTQCPGQSLSSPR